MLATWLAALVFLAALQALLVVVLADRSTDRAATARSDSAGTVEPVAPYARAA